MKHLSILVPNGEGNNLSSIVGAYKILNRANEIWIKKGKSLVFNIQLVGESGSEVEYYNGLFAVRPQTDLESISRTDFIIVPSLNHHFKKSLIDNSKMVEWIAKQYKNGAEIASICTGAFLLAATGILDGKNCSTHWSAANDFMLMFPEVNLQADHLITDENGIYTNGGAYSFLNLILYIVEKFYDRQTAILCAKIFQIEVNRHTQSEFAIFTGQKNHNDELVLKAQLYLEHHLDKKISIEDLSSKYNISRRNFDRRFIKATGNTPIEYAQRVKIESAKKAFETNRKTIHEVMFEVGYSDPKAFRELFKKLSGMSPNEYKGKYYKWS